MAGGLNVGIALSTDGGQHFANGALVNDQNSGGADEPTAALNPTTKEIWVYWRDFHHHAWVRKLQYDAQGVLHFLTDVMPATAQPVPYLPSAISAGTFHGAAHVAIAYPDSDDGGSCPQTCVQGVDCFKPQATNYFVTYSTDDARTWNTIQVAHDDAWPRCVTGSNPVSGHNRYNRNRPAIGIIHNFLVALTSSSASGSRVHVFSVSPYLRPTVTDVGSWPPPDDGARHDQFGAALAVARVRDPRAADNLRFSVALTWHDTRHDGEFGTTGTPDHNTRQLIRGATVGAGAWTTGIVSLYPGTPGNGQYPWINLSTTGASWGDYEGIAADDVTGNFVAAWADNRSGGDTEVWGAVLRPF